MNDRFIEQAINVSYENNNKTTFKLGAIAVYKGQRKYFASGVNSNDKQYFTGVYRFSVHAEIQACNNLLKSQRNKKIMIDLKKRLSTMHFEKLYEYIRRKEFDLVQKYICYFSQRHSIGSSKRINVYVARSRVDLKKQYLSKPCLFCMLELLLYNVTKIYFTTGLDDKPYDVLDLKNNETWNLNNLHIPLSYNHNVLKKN